MYHAINVYAYCAGQYTGGEFDLLLLRECALACSVLRGLGGCSLRKTFVRCSACACACVDVGVYVCVWGVCVYMCMCVYVCGCGWRYFQPEMVCGILVA